MAMSMIAHYPDQPTIVSAMVDLAVEEMNHYREVMRLILARKLTPGADLKDPYIHTLNRQVRKAAEHFLLDRLVVAAVVERRGAERFAIVADALGRLNTEKFLPSHCRQRETPLATLYRIGLQHFEQHR